MKCTLEIENGRMVGVKVHNMFIPFENQHDAETLMRKLFVAGPELNPESEYWKIRAEAEKIAKENQTMNDKLVDEISDLFSKYGKFPVAVA
jgi:hypothetical protein